LLPLVSGEVCPAPDCWVASPFGVSEVDVPLVEPSGDFGVIVPDDPDESLDGACV
jgi:hypothetical protein